MYQWSFCHVQRNADVVNPSDLSVSESVQGLINIVREARYSGLVLFIVMFTETSASAADKVTSFTNISYHITLAASPADHGLGCNRDKRGISDLITESFANLFCHTRMLPYWPAGHGLGRTSLRQNSRFSYRAQIIGDALFARECEELLR
jgi:hypothetical protein